MRTSHVGVIVVRRLTGGSLEVAVHINTSPKAKRKGGHIFHRVELKKDAQTMDDRVAVAIHGVNTAFGVNITHVISNLSLADLLYDQTMCSEHYIAIVDADFAHRRHPTPYGETKWVGVADLLQKEVCWWHWYQMPFVRQLCAVLSTMEEAYHDLGASRVDERVRRVHTAYPLCEIAREMVVRNGRHDLLYGVAIRGFRHGILDDDDWYLKHSISWMVAPTHEKAMVVNNVIWIAEQMQQCMHAAVFGLATTDRAAYVNTLKMFTAPVIEAHCRVFGTPPHEFAAKVWFAAAERLSAPPE